MYYVYILHSITSGKYYVGQTNDIENRLYRYNHGYVRSTKAYVPWELVCVIEKETRSDAMILEMKLKRLGRQRLLQFIEKYR